MSFPFSHSFFCCSKIWLLVFFFFYTYHSLKFDDSVLWLVVWCTAEAAGDMELLLWFSVDGDTMVGGVDDSYPELAAGDGCGPGLVDSWTFDRKEERMFLKKHAARRCLSLGLFF